MEVGRFLGSYRMLPVVPHVTWELAKKSAQPADYVWAGKGAAPLRATISGAGPGREKLPGKLFPPHRASRGALGGCRQERQSRPQDHQHPGGIHPRRQHRAGVEKGGSGLAVHTLS